MMRRAIIPTVFLFALVAGGGAQQAAPHSDAARPSTPTGAPRLTGAVPASSVGLRSQPSFWDDSTKMIRDGGWDIGSWLAYRRRLLVEASLTNRYFWFCITSFTANVMLLYLFYASRVSEDRKIWKATAVMTDLWNWALYADWTARNAIDKFNTHIDRCNRQATAQWPSDAASDRDANEMTRMQAERAALEQELAAAKTSLAERDRAIADLDGRVTEVSKSVAGGGDPKLMAQLMEEVNMLSVRNQRLEEQLLSAQRKLEQVAQEAR